MALTQTEIVGFLRNLLELLVTERATLVAAGIDAGKFEKDLRKEMETAVAANARQEALKRDLKVATQVVEETHGSAYRVGSSYLDAIIGAVGKTTPAGQNFRRLRSRIRMPGDQSSSEVTTPGEPAPEAKA